jgi:hypothetical protein
MDDADDDPTNLGAAAGLRDLVTQVRAYAAAQDLLTDEVLAQIRAQLTDAPPDVAEPPATPPTQVPPERSSWPTMSRAKREEQRLRRQLDMDAYRLLASAEPADADVYAYIAAKDGEIAAVLARVPDIPPHERIFLASFAFASHCYELGIRAVEVTAWVLQALRRFLSRHRANLDISRLFEPVAATWNAMEAAVAGELEPFRKLLPPRNKGAGRPPVPATARRKAYLAAATWVLRQDRLVTTDTAADDAIVRIFADTGIKLGKREPSSALRDVNELAKKRRTGRLPPTDRNASDILELFGTLKADAARHVADGQAWPLQARLAWVEPLAAGCAETTLS